MKSRSTGTPAGSPEMSAVSASPWDSPAVENRIMLSSIVEDRRVRRSASQARDLRLALIHAGLHPHRSVKMPSFLPELRRFFPIAQIALHKCIAADGVRQIQRRRRFVLAINLQGLDEAGRGQIQFPPIPPDVSDVA